MKKTIKVVAAIIENENKEVLCACMRIYYILYTLCSVW